MLWRVIASVAICVSCLSLPAQAQTFPSRPIRLIVPFPAGGPNDAIARVLAQSMSGSLKQSVVVQNRAGAGGTIGVNSVAKADPDGYTIGLTAGGPVAIIPNLQKTPYDWRTELQILTIAVTVPEVMAVPSSLEAENAQGFLSLLKASPGKYSYASVGRGSLPHLGAELMKLAMNVDIVHVPYTGAAPAIVDLLSGRTQLLIADITVLQPYVLDGKLRALAVSGKSRSPTLPDVPTVAEAGIPALQIDNWYGLIAPANLPPEVTTELYKSAVSALKEASVQELIKMQGATVVASSGADATAYILAEYERWGEVVRKANLAISE